MKLITRKEAKALGLTRFFQGKRCPHGHISERMVSTYSCLTCLRASKARYYAARPGKSSSESARYHRENREAILARQGAYRQTQPDKVRLARSRYLKANPHKRTLDEARRRVREKMAAVPLTAEERAKLRELYRLRRALTESTGIVHHVDHVVPVARGGVHHPDNLQVIPAVENLRKGARLTV